MGPLDNLIYLISVFRAPNVFNPWGEADQDYDPTFLREEAGYIERQANLRAHFSCPKPLYLLVGEAPGYQGCRYSGIAFTSERLIEEGKIPRVTSRQLTSRPKPWSEPSATVVWRVLHSLGIAESTVLWNAFAWHPHKPGYPLSNRPPTHKELVDGEDVFFEVVDYFSKQGTKIIAVGRTAEYLLEYLAYPSFATVRHPSMGGAKKFEEGMRKIVNEV